MKSDEGFELLRQVKNFASGKGIRLGSRKTIEGNILMAIVPDRAPSREVVRNVSLNRTRSGGKIVFLRGRKDTNEQVEVAYIAFNKEELYLELVVGGVQEARIDTVFRDWESYPEAGPLISSLTPQLVGEIEASDWIYSTDIFNRPNRPFWENIKLKLATAFYG